MLPVPRAGQVQANVRAAGAKSVTVNGCGRGGVGGRSFIGDDIASLFKSLSSTDNLLQLLLHNKNNLSTILHKSVNKESN